MHIQNSAVWDWDSRNHSALRYLPTQHAVPYVNRCKLDWVLSVSASERVRARVDRSQTIEINTHLIDSMTKDRKNDISAQSVVSIQWNVIELYVAPGYLCWNAFDVCFV